MEVGQLQLRDDDIWLVYCGRGQGGPKGRSAGDGVEHSIDDCLEGGGVGGR